MCPHGIDVKRDGSAAQHLYIKLMRLKSNICSLLGSEGEREADRQTETDRQRERETGRERERGRQTDRQRERNRQTERERERERGREREE